MNNSVKSAAALRQRNSAEPAEFGAATKAENLRENLYRFPTIGIPPMRAALQAEPPRAEPLHSDDSHPETQASEPPLARLQDLAAELEAALMSDLNKAMSSRAPDVVRIAPSPGQLQLPLAQAEIEHAVSPAPPQQEDVPQHDRLAVELLLARGQRLRPAAPRPQADPEILEDRLAGELALRLSEAVDGLNLVEGEAIVGDRDHLARPPRRQFALNQSIVAMAVALVVVAGGALLTVRALTSSPEVPVAAELDGAMAAGDVQVAAAEPEPAVAPEGKQTYDRAAEDLSLPEAPQLRGSEMMLPAGLSAKAGSAGGTADVEPSVRAAYAMDAAPAAAVAATNAAIVPEAPAAPVAATNSEVGGAAATPASPAAAAPVATPTTKAASIADLGPGRAQVTSGVKLRGNPDNAAPTVGYLKPGAQVEVVSCKGWCEVVAGDKRGFVFKRFLAAL